MFHICFFKFVYLTNVFIKYDNSRFKYVMFMFKLQFKTKLLFIYFHLICFSCMPLKLRLPGCVPMMYLPFQSPGPQKKELLPSPILKGL